QYSDEHADADGHADQYADQYADEYSDQHADADEHSNQYADEHAHQHTDEHADEYAHEYADQHADLHSDVHADLHADTDSPRDRDDRVLEELAESLHTRPAPVPDRLSEGEQRQRLQRGPRRRERGRSDHRQDRRHLQSRECDSTQSDDPGPADRSEAEHRGHGVEGNLQQHPAVPRRRLPRRGHQCLLHSGSHGLLRHLHADDRPGDR